MLGNPDILGRAEAGGSSAGSAGSLCICPDKVGELDPCHCPRVVPVAVAGLPSLPPLFWGKILRSSADYSWLIWGE